MYPVLVLGILIVLTASSWRSLYRLRVIWLPWPSGMTPVGIAKYCRQALYHYGVDSVVTYEINCDLRVPSWSMRNQVETIGFICRDNLYINGKTTFSDIKDSFSAMSERRIPVLITINPIGQELTDSAAVFGIAAISRKDLGDLASAVRRLSRGEVPEYHGLSRLLHEKLVDSPLSRIEAQRFAQLARESEKMGNWTLAEEYWRTGAGLDGQFWETQIGYARALLRNGNNAEATRIIDDSYEKFLCDQGAITEIAQLHDLNGNFDEALRKWDDVICRFPTSWAAYRGKLFTLTKRGDLEEASKFADSSLKYFPNELDAKRDCAQLAEKRKDWVKAERYWKELLTLDHEAIHAIVALSRALRAQHKISEAESFLHPALDRAPSDFNLQCEWVLCAEDRSNCVEALERWNRLITDYPHEWHAYRGKARVLKRLGHKDEADQFVVCHAADFPTNADALHDVARLAEQRGSWHEAEISWRSFLDCKQDASWAHAALGRSLIEQEKLGDADAVLKAGLIMFPSDPEINRLMARLSELRRTRAV